VGALDHPPATHLDRRRHPTHGDLAHHGPLGQHLPARPPVVAGVQVHHRPLGQHPDQADGVQRRRQQPVVAVIGRGGQRDQRDTARLHGDGAFEALFAAVDRAWAGNLAATGRLGDTAVHRQLLQLQAEQPVIGGQHQQA
jgi:hypothetical protein